MDEQWGDAVMAKVVARRNPSVTKLTDGELRKLLGQITAMALEHVAIDAVKPNPRNAKQHPEQQVLLIAENIRKFGVNHPLLIDENNVLIGDRWQTLSGKTAVLSEPDEAWVEVEARRRPADGVRE
jgi:hypothetical protein